MPSQRRDLFSRGSRLLEKPVSENLHLRVFTYPYHVVFLSQRGGLEDLAPVNGVRVIHLKLSKNDDNIK